ncbi:MAG: hypothetical protein H0U42_01570 [Thermoleophilaceae bacterium]|nr:hypothetical protein [Thermoleophilaceae bacterium]
MGIELLWWAGCPSNADAERLVRDALDSLGLEDEAIERLEIVDQADAARERFVGSPTIRVGGRDLLEPSTDQLPSLTCRVYRLRDGRPSPTPDPAELRSALADALVKEQRGR